MPKIMLDNSGPAHKTSIPRKCFYSSGTVFLFLSDGWFTPFCPREVQIYRLPPFLEKTLLREKALLFF